jgi:tetratricopeptide (TPR) repeat protein
MKIKSLFLLGPALLLASTLFAQLPAAGTSGAPTLESTVAQPPMTDKEVISELKKGGAAQLQKDLDKRGVAFEMDADIEKRLRKAKATDDVIKAVTAAGPKERENAAKAAAQASGGVMISPEESADFKALQTELDPDKAVALAEAFVQKHPKSEVLSYAYAFEANAYEMKSAAAKTDSEMKSAAAKIVEFGEKSVDLKKDNLMSLLIVTSVMPTPQYIGQHQADEEKILTRAESYAHDALTAIDNLKKPANESDADFAKRKATYQADIHSDLGMIHLERAQEGLMGLDKEELAKSEKEYRLAVSNTDRPDPSAYYRLGEACRLLGKFDDAIAAFTKASETGQGAVKQFAEQQIELVKRMKAEAAAPAKK